MTRIYDEPAAIEIERDGYKLESDSHGLLIRVTDYHAGPLHLPWRVLIEMARLAGHSEDGSER